MGSWLNKMVTFVLIIINVLVFLLQQAGFITYDKFALVPMFVKNGEYYRLITGAFMHASLQHILANMYSFYNLGSYCENFTTKRNYIIALIVSLIGSSLMVFNFSNPQVYTVGFSGVVFGVLGFYAVCLYKNDGRLDEYEKNYLIRVILSNVIVSLMPGISWQGHLGGFIGGLISGLILLR